MISPNWLTVEINKMKIKTLNVVSTGWINIKFEVNTKFKKNIDSKYPPITPDYVFFGLILVNFGPLKILPKM